MPGGTRAGRSGTWARWHDEPSSGTSPLPVGLAIRPRSSAVALLVALHIAGLPGGPGPSLAAATSADPDGDGLPTWFELTRSRTNPYNADTDADGLRDGLEDPDRDRLTNRQEYVAGTDPRRADTDGDGIRDASEDPDHDRLPNWFEFAAGRIPCGRTATATVSPTATTTLTATGSRTGRSTCAGRSCGRRTPTATGGPTGPRSLPAPTRAAQPPFPRLACRQRCPRRRPAPSSPPPTCGTGGLTSCRWPPTPRRWSARSGPRPTFTPTSAPSSDIRDPVQRRVFGHPAGPRCV